jgi:hypothetical protein
VQIWSEGVMARVEVEDGGVGFGFLDAFHDAGPQLAAEAVDRRVVHRDDGDAVADGIRNRFAHLRGSPGGQPF